MRIPMVIIIGLLSLLAAASPVLAGVTVTAQVDRTTVAPGESVKLQVTVSGGKGEIDLSGLTDFKVVSRGTGSSIQIINGRMSRQENYTYLLIPQGRGRLTIPALPVEVDGEIHRSQPIVITVTDQPDSGGTQAQATREAWVTAEVSDPAPYEGQQITYTFRLYNTVQINDAKFQPPEFDGFTAKEIKDRRSYRKIIDGREAMVSEIDYVLTPLKTGGLTIEPAVLQVGIVRQNRTGRRSPFDNLFNDPFFSRGSVDMRIIQTGPLKINVRPLPPVPANLKFSGLVGEFDLKAEMESTDLKVGDSATLAVTVEGSGNIMDARAPEVEVPSAFKAYADTPQEEVVLDRSGSHGKKVFRTALVPLEAGRFQLPAVSLTYFDVDQKAYRTLTAPAPVLTVAASLQTPGPAISISPEPLKPVKKKVTFTGRDILPPKENLTAVQSCRPLSWIMFLIGLAGPAMAFGGTIVVQRMRRRDTRPAALMRIKARKALKYAQNSPDQEFLTPLYQALTAAILGAAGRMGETLTWKEAETLLLESGRSAEEARQAADLLSRIESGKFSGGMLDERQRDELLSQTRRTIRKLVP